MTLAIYIAAAALLIAGSILALRLAFGVGSFDQDHECAELQESCRRLQIAVRERIARDPGVRRAMGLLVADLKRLRA